MKSAMFSKIMSKYGKLGGKRCLETMTKEERRARASKAGKASAKARKAKARKAKEATE